MDPILSAAESALRRHPAPAVRLGELLRALRAELARPSLDAHALRALLESRPDRFRVLDPWKGPWRLVADRSRTDGTSEPWVVVVSDPGGDAHRPVDGSLPARLRTSVRWMALGVDGASTREVARWHGLALGEGSARERLRAA